MNSSPQLPFRLTSIDASEKSLLQVPSKRIDVAFLPNQVEMNELQGRTVVVTDVLRATTTMIAALANGCQRILPKPSVESALQCHAGQPNSILGGERGGRIVDGFHLGNSPLDYTRETILNKTLILATTNGTVALERCRQARRVLIGAMVNLAAVAREVESSESLTIICSGTDGEFTSEDVLFAGALIERLIPVNQTQQLLEQQDQLSDRALIALHHWLAIKQTIDLGGSLVDFFRVARGGVNLVKIGMINDLAYAAQIDSHQIVPQLDIEGWEIC